MKFVYNPFTNKLDPTESGGAGGGGISTLNTLSPDGSGNFSLTAGTGISVTAGTNAVTLATNAVRTMSGDTGTATVSGNAITVKAGISTKLSGASVKFTGSGSTLTMSLMDSLQNVMIGGGTGNLTTTGTKNVGLGHFALSNITDSYGNIGIGDSALTACTSGIQNTAIGGLGALANLTTGSGNIGIGNNALYILPAGSNNTAIGTNSGISYSASESDNILIHCPGESGESNVLRIGEVTGAGLRGLEKAFIQGITGVDSSGFTAPVPVYIDSTTGQLGYGAGGGGGGSVTIDGDTGSITGSSLSITTGQATNTSGATVSFANSGTDSVLNLSNAIGDTFIGKTSGNATANGGSNTAVGVSACSQLTFGATNTAVGFNALAGCAASSDNVAVGYNANASTTTGSANTVMGSGALEFGSGFNNTAIGYGALRSLGFGGSFNTAIGQQTGYHYSAGSETNNILIGSHVYGVSGDSNVLRIGSAPGMGPFQITQAHIQGISGSTVDGATVLCDVDGQLGTIASSKKYKENISDIGSSSILDLRPVKFNYISDVKKTTVYGLIAEEVESSFPDLVLYKDGEPESVKYHELPALLLAEIQRLNKRIEALEAK